MHTTLPAPLSALSLLGPALRSRPRQFVRCAAVLMLVAGLAHAQGPDVTGRWAVPSPSSLSSNANLSNTAIHMAWMRGHVDWAADPTHFHSFLLFWNNRDEFCIDPVAYASNPNATPKFHGALYGWRPGMNASGADSMIRSGFTRIQMNDLDLDPGGEANGHDIFCSGHTLLHSGKLLVAGGAEAENTGSLKTAIFDPHVTSGSRWTHLDSMKTPRWYPTLLQTASKQVYSYAGLQHARMHTIFGRDNGASAPRWQVGRHQVTSSGSWDADALPFPDAGATGPDGTRPRPRDHAAGGVWRNGTEAITRTVVFGGRDSLGQVRSDVWWLLHIGTEGTDSLRWFKFNNVIGTDQPFDGLWKHSAIIDEHQGDLWIWGGIDGNGTLSNAVYRGAVTGPSANRNWTWTRHLPSGGPAARQLSSAAYDEKYNRMIVYGGYTDAAGTTITSDDDVYALSLGSSPTWTKLTWSNAQSSSRPVALADAALAPGPTDGEHLSGPKANMYLYGGEASSGIKGDVWLMYFPDASHVSWRKLDISTSTPGPGARKGARAIRDHDSWNLRVFGGVDASSGSDGNVYRIDIYYSPGSAACDAMPRPWVTQYGTEHASQGTTGSIVVFDPYEVPAMTMERHDAGSVPADGWSLVTGSTRYQSFYPLLFPLPDGDILDVTAREFYRSTHRFDSSTGSWGAFPGSATPELLWGLGGGSAVMRRLLDGSYEVMKCGTKDTEGASGTGLWARLRLNADGSVRNGWAGADAMNGRVFHNLVTLPDGKVLVTGGVSVNVQGLPTNTPYAVKRPQIWDAADSSWTSATTLADEGLLRGYHSTALLLPDGRVLTGGGNDDGPDKVRFSVFSPPQWFDASGNHPATGTTLVLPDTIGYGATTPIRVSTATAVEKVVLLRPGAVTHGFNSSQMYAELPFTHCENSADLGHIEITTPPANSIPPGDYLLFVIIGGRWSVGQWVRLEVGANTHFLAGAPEGCPTYCEANPADPACGGGEGGGGEYEGGHAARRDPGALAAQSTELPTPRWIENTVFAGAADGTVVTDRLRLPTGPLQVGDVSRIRLSHRGAGSDVHSSVRLVAVDHEQGEEAVATSRGIVVGTRVAATRVTDAGGAELTDALASAEGITLSAGDVLEVTLPATAGEVAMWLATSGHPAGDGGIRIEEAIEADWREVAVHTPRARRDVEVVSGLSSARLRLVALGQHRLHGVGRFTPSETGVTSVSPPMTIEHSESGPIAAGEGFSLSGGESALVDFATPAAPAAGVRDWFLQVTGTPQGYQPSAAALRSRHSTSEEPVVRIAAFRLAGGMPNPFTSTTRVLFELPRATKVRLEVFDMQGRLVRMVEEAFEPGVGSLVWDRRTTSGALAPRGVYPIRVTAGEDRANGRLTVR